MNHGFDRLRAAKIITASALALGTMAALPAQAQAPTPGFSAATKSSVAGCPYIVWRLARNPATGAVNGIAYYADMSGVSSVSGMRGASGHFDLELKATHLGSGPVGRISGTVSPNGAIKGMLIGQGCANATVDLELTDDLSHLNITSGG